MVQHQTVLLEEAVDVLMTDQNGFYIDGTYGRGGHSQAILNRLGAAGKLLVIDKDPQAVAHAQSHLAADDRVIIRQGSFASVGSQVAELGWAGKVQGVLLDLGVSSPQLDDAERGFSFSQNGPLDMRMDYSTGISAAQWVETAPEQELADVIYRFGEERFSRRIARAIVRERHADPIVTTGRLAEVVAKANPSWERRKHPATRTFQAIRIFLNGELDDLSKLLAVVTDLLAVGGRLVTISFHSLEDRIVKRFIRSQEQGDTLPRHLPVRDDQLHRRMRRIGKVVRASAAEVSINPRARSAVMRAAEKIS